MYRLTDNQIEQAIGVLLKEQPEVMSACIDAIYHDLDGYEAAEEFHRRHMTPSLGTITVHDKDTILKIVDQIRDRIRGKTVVEIGAGVGFLAIGMAMIAKQVYAIESDPAWSWAFTKVLYEVKPPNLTFIFGKSETMVGILKADIAIVVTRSGHKYMKALGRQLAPDVIDVYEEQK